MASETKLKIGNKLIKRGEVFTIFKISQEKFAGKMERYVHFRPLFETTVNNTLICSIPESNITQSEIRPPISDKEMDQLLENLSQAIEEEEQTINIATAKSILEQNDIHQIATVLRVYWHENKIRTELTKAKSDILKNAIEKIAGEIAVVYEISINKAHSILDHALGKQQIQR